MKNTARNFRLAFPVGTNVLAADQSLELRAGVIIAHYTDDDGDGLTVRFDTDFGTCQYPYSLIDVERPENSYVVVDKQSNGGPDFDPAMEGREGRA